jgi:hypothetical protein
MSCTMHFIPCTLGFTTENYAMLYLSSKAETTATEDALCSMLYEDGVASVGKIYVNCGWRKGPRNN